MTKRADARRERSLQIFSSSEWKALVGNLAFAGLMVGLSGCGSEIDPASGPSDPRLGATFSDDLLVDMIVEIDNPSRRILVQPSSTGSPMECVFNILAMPAEERATLTVDWDFGDGSTATGDIVTHTYSMPGEYLVSVTATHPHGLSAYTLTTVVTVDPDANQSAERLLVLVEGEVDYGGNYPTLIATARASALLPDETVRFVWEFADGTQGEGAEVTHVVTSSGPYRIRVTAETSQGRTADYVKHLTVMPLEGNIEGDSLPPEPAEIGGAEVVTDAGTVQPPVIWFHSAGSNPPESLDVALSSGLVTHVLLLSMHRADLDQEHPRVVNAVETIQQSGVKLIWGRCLWPYYEHMNISFEAALNSDYYSEEIEHLRAEAAVVGADAVALDLEPYGTSPMKPYLKGDYEFSDDQVVLLQAAVQDTVIGTGTVDYVFPAGSWDPRHPYSVLSSLGRIQISEHTYYNNEAFINLIPYEYDIFGAHLNTVREHPEWPTHPYFLVEDLFMQSDLWSETDGLFLYSYFEDSLAVAENLVRYAATLPD